MKMSKKIIFFILLVVILLLIVIIVKSKSSNANQYDAFAKCITAQGAKMWGADWCNHCKEQKKMFGGSWQYITYIECAIPGRSDQTKQCGDAGIRAYPTWEFKDGTKREGKLSFEELASLTTCPLL